MPDLAFHFPPLCPVHQAWRGLVEERLRAVQVFNQVYSRTKRPYTCLWVLERWISHSVPEVQHR